MKALDFFQITSLNIRKLGFRLSSAQVLLAVASGQFSTGRIVRATRLHRNSVSNILKALCEQEYLSRTHDYPFIYKPTEKGLITAAKIIGKLAITNHETI